MKSVLPPSVSAEDEISALTALLQKTGQRLEVLTGGEVDSVVDRTGRVFLLKGVQAQLRDAENSRQAAILNSLPANIALLDRRGVIVSVNEAWRRFAGGSALHVPGRAVGADYLGICDKAQGEFSADAREAASGIRSVLNGGARGFAFEYPCRAPGGQGWFLMTVTPLALRHPNGVVVMHLDITERKRSEQELQAFGAAMDALADAIYLVDRTSMQFVHVNDTACRMMRKTRDELMALKPWEILSISRAELERAYDTLIASGAEAEPMELLRPRADGAQAWVELRRHALRSGDRWTIVTLVRDVTERRRAVQKLHDSEARFRSLTMLSSDWFWEQDEQHRFSKFSGGEGVEGWGPDQDRAVGLHRWDLGGVLPISCSWAEHKGMLDAHKPFRNFEYQRILGDGRLQCVEASGEPLFDAGGCFTGYRGVATEITVRKAAEAKIFRLNRIYAVLSGINSAIVRHPERDSLFREVCRIALTEGGFLIARVIELDLNGKARIAASTDSNLGPSHRIVDDFNADPEHCQNLLALGLRTGEPLVSNDVAIDTRMPNRVALTERGTFALALLPIVVEKRIAGALILHARDPGMFDKAELRLLLEVVSNVSFALEHIEKEAKVRRLTRVYAVLSGINALIVRARDRDELFKSACRIAVEHGKFTMAWIGTVDRSAMELVPVASAGSTQDPLALINQRFRLDVDAPAGNTMSARAIREKKVVIANDVQNDPEVLFKEEHALRGSRSMALLPLKIAGEVEGLLALYSNEVGFFDDEEVKLLDELAGDIAFAIDNLRKQERLDYLAYYDVLTGLANRRLFLERVAQYMRGAAGNGQKLALFFLDLERFRNINDSLGRPAGDALLKQVADWLSRGVGDAHLLGRLGGDHFAVVLPELKAEGNVAGLLERSIRAFLDHVFIVGDTELRISAKVGVALFPDDAADADALLRNAEIALKKAKARGDRYLFYRQKMNAAAAGKLTLENQLRQALDNEEFVLHYQPKVSLDTGRLAGAEALIRWNDPRTGLVLPDRFIPVLEETGLIYNVGRWALRRAVGDFLRWRAAGLAPVRIAVNVSPLQLRQASFISEIEQVIAIEADAAAGLELEITESLIMEDVKHSIASLKAIRAVGVTIAIDDFGTGFSSLSYLARLPVDTVKIDRSFVSDMTAGPEGLALVSTIINLAHSLKLNVVAEGVETEEQSRLLRLLRCNEMQGFMFSKAVPAEILESKFLAPPGAG